MSTTGAAQILALAAQGPIRARDLDATGVARTQLRRLCQQGRLERVSRGLYRLADSPATELHSLAQVAKRVPRGTICLLSALQLHGIGSEVPHAVWLLIESHSRAPRLEGLQIEIVRASGEARDHGVEEHVFEGVPVRVTSAAKTVADCFRYRRHVGLDVALDALRGYLADHAEKADPGATRIDALIAAAKADRVYSVVRPYLEALT